MKQVQDAYIVAATRTPIGRSHKGFFRNYRPDDLLAQTLRDKMIFDGRNLFEPTLPASHGLGYVSIGRPMQLPR